VDGAPAAAVIACTYACRAQELGSGGLSCRFERRRACSRAAVALSLVYLITRRLRDMLVLHPRRDVEAAIEQSSHCGGGGRATILLRRSMISVRMLCVPGAGHAGHLKRRRAHDGLVSSSSKSVSS
jgi:hypothetical protein